MVCLWHYRQSFPSSRKAKVTAEWKVRHNAREGQISLGWKHLRAWPWDIRHGPETRRLVFTAGRFMFDSGKWPKMSFRCRVSDSSGIQKSLLCNVSKLMQSVPMRVHRKRTRSWTTERASEAIVISGLCSVEHQCKHGNEQRGPSILGGELLDRPRDYWLSRRPLLHGISYTPLKG
jgi:hypothetical protein